MVQYCNSANYCTLLYVVGNTRQSDTDYVTLGTIDNHSTYVVDFLNNLPMVPVYRLFVEKITFKHDGLNLLYQKVIRLKDKW